MLGHRAGMKTLFCVMVWILLSFLHRVVVRIRILKVIVVLVLFVFWELGWIDLIVVDCLSARTTTNNVVGINLLQVVFVLFYFYLG